MFRGYVPGSQGGKRNEEERCEKMERKTKRVDALAATGPTVRKERKRTGELRAFICSRYQLTES